MAAQQQGKPPTKTHWRSVHKRKNAELLYAEDLGPPGYTVDVEVVDSGVFTVKGVKGLYDDKDLPWLAFAGKKKKLGLGRTNCKTMVSVTGTPVVEEWRGWITLLVVVTDYNDRQTGRREKTDAIRIAPTRPGAAKSIAPRRPTSSSGDEILRESDPEEFGDPLTDEERRAIELAEREGA